MWRKHGYWSAALCFVMSCGGVQSNVKNYLCQADPTRDLVGDVLPIDVSYPGAGDVLHPTTTHPNLQAHTDQESEKALVFWSHVHVKLRRQKTGKVKEGEGRGMIKETGRLRRERHEVQWV